MEAALTGLFVVVRFLCCDFNGESFDMVVRSTEVSLSYFQWPKF